MSQIKLTPNASGTGTFTIASPATSTDRTLTLPDSTGTILNDGSSLSATNLTGDIASARITAALNASGSAPVYACRAWVNFNGTGTVAIRASGNVSSITDNGIGDYTVNFTTAMPDANYSAQAIANSLGSTIAAATRIGTYSTSSVLLYTTTFSTTKTDFDAVSVAIFR